MKLHLPKFLLTAVVAASACFSQVYADVSFTAQTAGVSTGNASFTKDGETSQSLSGGNIDLSPYSGVVELSGSANADQNIAKINTNGGYGGRVSFASGKDTSDITKLIFNGGIEANVTNLNRNHMCPKVFQGGAK